MNEGERAEKENEEKKNEEKKNEEVEINNDENKNEEKKTEDNKDNKIEGKENEEKENDDTVGNNDEKKIKDEIKEIKDKPKPKPTNDKKKGNGRQEIRNKFEEEKVCNTILYIESPNELKKFHSSIYWTHTTNDITINNNCLKKKINRKKLVPPNKISLKKIKEKIKNIQRKEINEFKEKNNY